MTTLAHTLSAAYLSITFSKVSPSQTGFIVSALVAAAILDADHLFYIMKDGSLFQRGKLHKARSFLHELPGFIVIGVITLILGLYNQQLAKIVGLSSMLHLAQDMLVGISVPFHPFDSSEITIIPQNFLLKITLDIVTIALFTFLWIMYLKG